MANRLANATSPYLLQHAHNPVDWYEWGPEALADAKRRDVPILLSVGYAACHWCHVMAHESFEDPATAKYMNENFINIKVDREERPDIDAVYMRATQAMTGHGGWPTTCVLTPEGEPFFTGTYFPPEPKQNTPAFSQVLQALCEAWTRRRDEIDRVAADVMSHLSDQADIAGNGLAAAELDQAVDELADSYDAEAGGFGSSPKFPPSMVLEFLLRHHDRTKSAAAIQMVQNTCEAMARGGIYDQLGGGFARYSVDRFWQVPHFEKMLYDNALLLRLYLHWWRQSQSPLARRIVEETAQFMLTELRTPEGGFASALDADSANSKGVLVEGEYYGWSPHELMKVLGAKDAAYAIEQFGVTASGTFERGLSTLQRRVDPEHPQRYEQIRQTLLHERSKRVRPARDDKVIAAWNGWAITALTEASILLDRPELGDAALAAADLLIGVHGVTGPEFVRTSRDGEAGKHCAVLDDHGAVAEAFLALLGATGDAVWLGRARSVLDRVIAHFTAEDGGFYDTSDDAEALIVRPRDDADNAYPSGASAAIHALIGFAAITGEQQYRQAAERALAASSRLATGAPRFAGSALSAAEAMLAGPLEVAVVGSPTARRPLHRAALTLTSPGAIVVAGEPGLEVALFAAKTLIEGQPAAYVCRNFTCQLPVTDPELLSG